MIPHRIQCRYFHKDPPHTRRVIRNKYGWKPWGNPHTVPACDGDAAEAVRRFVAEFAHDTAYRQRLRAELAGWNLGCICPIGSPCHADILLQWANAPEEEPCPQDRSRGRD